MNSNEIREIADKHELTAASLQALIEVTEATAELDADEALPALRALFTILKAAEQSA